MPVSFSMNAPAAAQEPMCLTCAGNGRVASRFWHYLIGFDQAGHDRGEKPRPEAKPLIQGNVSCALGNREEGKVPSSPCIQPLEHRGDEKCRGPLIPDRGRGGD